MGVYMLINSLQHVQWEGVSCDITHTRGFPAPATAGGGFHLGVSHSTRGVQVSTNTVNHYKYALTLYKNTENNMEKHTGYSALHANYLFKS